MTPGDAIRVLRLTPHLDWAQLGARAQWPVAAGDVGGMAAQVSRQTTGLARVGVESSVLALYPGGGPVECTVDERVSVTGVGAPRFSRRPETIGRQSIAWWIGVRERLRAHPPDCDIVHVHCSGVAWPLAAARNVQRIVDRPLVLTLHCSIIATYRPASRRDAAVQVLARALERRAIAAADRTITLTARAREALIEQAGASPDAICAVPDCVDVDALRARATPAAADAFARRFGIPRGQPTVIYVGRVSREKGWPDLVSLCERSGERPPHVVVCGGGPDTELLQATITEKGLAERVTVTGYVAHDEVPAALACADVLVLPSVHEELGSVLIEAMALGLPAVAYGVGGVAEALGRSETGIAVTPGAVDELADAVERVLSEPRLRARLAAAGPPRARALFSLEVVSGSLREIYERVLAARTDAELPAAA